MTYGRHLKKRNLQSVRHEEPRPAPGELEVLRAFLNSGQNGDRKPEELTSARDLERWLSQRRLLPEGVRLSDDDLRRALRLRWALCRLVFSRSDGGEQEHGIFRQVSEGVSFRMVFEGGPDARLEPSGEGAAPALGKLLLLFTGARKEGRWRLFKPCGHCREIFYDHTRNRQGRWCRTPCGEYERKRRARRRRKTGVV